ncbi:YwpF-like family protein [Allobacillus halotolerans]|uniref:YwpF-like family protein n=1 Tax=Allobacillus halotolerans TaxID=570278 RepID=A0ABS6GN56_9BACI|nr:YwpF-like family protein [Allobacillus halotolerans]MBU6080551.1 YwpF-like family protein [Allobacillus halotolerans]
MKTFKLISLTTLEKLGDELQNKEIEFYEGLIIDREIDRDRWLVEGYMPKSYEDFFRSKLDKNREIVFQVRITKTENPKATLVGKVEAIEEVDDNISVIIIGNMVNRERELVEQTLQDLIEAGYQGEQLLIKFKEKNQESIL